MLVTYDNIVYLLFTSLRPAGQVRVFNVHIQSKLL